LLKKREAYFHQHPDPPADKRLVGDAGPFLVRFPEPETEVLLNG
jgi:hypothetical protein